jgi:hypothetical protein
MPMGDDWHVCIAFGDLPNCGPTAMWSPLAGHLAAQGWRVRPGRRYLIVWADCEDHAEGVAQALSGDGGADANTALSVGPVSYSYIPPGSLPVPASS